MEDEMDELGWPIHTQDGKVLARAAIIESMGRLWLATMFLLGLFIASRGWTAGHQRPAWPTHFVYATIAWTIFTVPVGWVAWSFWRVIKAFEEQDRDTERLRELRKLQELEDRERREEAKATMERRNAARARGRAIARERAQRVRMLEGQEQIELELGDG